MFKLTRMAALMAVSLFPLSLTILAHAHDAAEPGAHASMSEHMLKSMDSNGDGRISRDEYLAAAATHFQAIDAQHKGRVDATDIASSPAALERIDHRAQAMVDRLDQNGAGYVTSDEFVAAAQKRFARMDRNGDGKLTPDEMTTERRHGGHDGADDKAGKHAQAAQQRFARIDANGDGMVTPDEYVAAARKLYAEFDTHHDGKVTAAEIEASPRTQERAVHVADRMVRRMDGNGDGVVAQDEFMAAAQKRFARIDRNGDGFIDADEADGRHWAGRNHKPNS
jgi:Ca2+-binding EF-hand superfamily protein